MNSLYKKKGWYDMKPRIFVSSTFYDLRYVRESLKDFIESFGYEAILSENGDIGYTPGQPLDESCYDAMKHADMAILIVGGRYGSPATGETSSDFDEFLSVTNKEFRTAINSKIPMFVFIDSRVLAEYNVYAKTMKKDKVDTIKNIAFDATEHVNVFRFIQMIKLIPTLPIEEFGKIADITQYMKKQWAEMLKKFLNSAKTEVSYIELDNIMKSIKSDVDTISVLLNDTTRKILTQDNNDDYNNLMTRVAVKKVANAIANSFKFISNLRTYNEVRDYLIHFVSILPEATDQKLLVNLYSDDPDQIEEFYSLFDYQNIVIEDIEFDVKFTLEQHYELLKTATGQQDIVQELLKIENLKLMQLYSYEINM